MNKKTILLLGGGAVALCICLFVGILAVALVGGFGLTQPAVDVGDKFMQSLKDGNYGAAFATFHPGLQREFGNAPGLKRAVENGKAQPNKWSYSSRQVDNDKAKLEGAVTMTGGEGTLIIELVNTNDGWKITAFNLRAK